MLTLGLILLHSTAGYGAPIERTPGLPPVLDQPTLLVTHASRTFIPGSQITPGLDQWVADARACGLSTVYLMNDDEAGDDLWLTSDRAPTWALYSRSGEHSLDVSASEIWSAGGYLELCQARSIRDAADSFFARNRRSRRFTVRIGAAATYSEKYAYRDPENEISPIVELLGLDHDPSASEVLAILGERRFARAVRTNLQLISDRYRLQVRVDGVALGGKFGRREAGRSRTIVVDFRRTSPCTETR